MRTDAEILARIEAVKDRDWLGFEQTDLKLRLGWPAIKPFLKDPDKGWEPEPREPEAIEAVILAYMPFAWDKANNCRGISAGRSLSHMAAWLWLMGLDAAAEAMRDYSHYGKPQLRAVCEHFGWDWRQWDDGDWRNNELEDGLGPPESVDPLPQEDRRPEDG